MTHTITMLYLSGNGDAAWNVCKALNGENYCVRLEEIFSRSFERGAVAVDSVDGAIAVALAMCGLTYGGYVFVPTYSGSLHVDILHSLGASVVFVDSDPLTHCISVAALETAFEWASLQSRLPCAVVIDDAFGSVADFTRLLPVCRAYGVPVIELACDGGLVGSSLFVDMQKKKLSKGDSLVNGNIERIGRNGDYVVVGFEQYSGSGAVLLVDREERERTLAIACREIADCVGWNCRMNNVVAAIDCSIVQNIKKIEERSKKNFTYLLNECSCICEKRMGDSFRYALCRRLDIKNRVEKSGFTVRTAPLLHCLDRYKDYPFFEHEQGFCVAKTLCDGFLIDMSFSPIFRRKLVKILKS